MTGAEERARAILTYRKAQERETAAALRLADAYESYMVGINTTGTRLTLRDLAHYLLEFRIAKGERETAATVAFPEYHDAL